MIWAWFVCNTLEFSLLQDYFDFRCMGIKIAAPGTRCIDGFSSEYCVSRRWGCSFHLELGFQNVEKLLVCHILYFILLQDYFDFRCMGVKIAASGTRCIDGSSSEYCVSHRWGCSFHLELGFQNVE